MALPPLRSWMLFLKTGIEDENDFLRTFLAAGGSCDGGAAAPAASTAPGSTPSFFMDALSIILDRTACRII